MTVARTLLLLLIAALFLLSVAFVLPFLDFFLLAVLLTYLLLPVQERLEKRVSARIAAAGIVIGSSIVVILPLLAVVRRATTEAISLVRALRTGDITLTKTEYQIQQVTGMEVDIARGLQTVVNDLQITNLVSAFGLVTHVIVGFGLTLFLLYFFLKDREDLLWWLYRTLPLPEAVQNRLYKRFDEITSAVLHGHVLVAVVQGLLAGIGLAVTGIPNATFWTVVMAVLSILPFVGSFLVWGPASIYLFLNGQIVPATGLFLWGTIVVGLSDDYLRPVLVDRYAKINPSVIIIGVLGGIYVIGIMGIFFGPVIIGMLRATLDVFHEEFGPSEAT